MLFTKNRKVTRMVARMTAVLMVLLAIIPSGFTFSMKKVYGASSTLSGTTKSGDGDYFYDFRDGSVIPKTTDGKSDESYESLKVKVGNQNAYQYKDEYHGMLFKKGNSIEIAVTGPTRISVGDCEYSTMEKLTLVSEDGSYSETKDTKAGCYHNDGSMIVFNYTGEAATILTLNFNDQIYVPCIQVEKIHKEYNFMNDSIIPIDTDGKSDVTYNNLKVKVGVKNAYQHANDSAKHGVAFKDGNSIELKVSGPTKITVGDCLYSDMEEMVLTDDDATYTETKKTKTGCYHNDGSALVFNYNEDHAATLTLSFTDTTYVPIIKTDLIVEDQPDNNGVAKDTVQMYNFADGSVVPDTCDSANPLKGEITSKNGFLTVTGAGDLYMHDTQHGLAVYNGNTFAVKVAGDATVTFNLCQYGGDPDAVIKASSKKGEFTSNTSEKLQGSQDDGLSAMHFSYKGVATTLLFTVNAVDGAEMYLHGINVANLPAESENPQLVGNGKTDVWDFGAEQLDETKYNNKLSVGIMNSWYDASVVAGSTNNTIGSFATDEFFFNPAGRTNNRIRTSNTAVTRYDSRDAITIDGTTLTGYLYSNNTSPVIYAGVKLYKNDVLTVYTGSNGGPSTIYCESPSGKIQTGESSVTGAKLTFYASEYGIYKLYSTNEKLVIYRALRQHTQPVTVSGAVDVSQADGIAAKDYTVRFTNQQTNEVTEVPVVDGKYSTCLFEGYQYKMSLNNANGYVINSTTELNIAAGDGNKNLPVEIKKVDLVTVTGELKGLSEKEIAKLQLSFVNPNYVYVPEFTISGTTFTAQLEKGVTYDIVAEQINDFYLSDITKIGATVNETKDITFTAKPLYTVGVTFDNLPASMVADAIVTFTNIHEDGYSYSFKGNEPMKLRDGQYKVNVKNIATAPYTMKATSDVKVDGNPVNKVLKFEQLSNWDFAKLNGNPGIEIMNENPFYSGLALTKDTVLENKIYLLVNQNGEVAIPAKKGDLVTLQYCYCAAFSINDEVQVTSNSGSTGTFETTTYTAKEDGNVVVKGTGQTYFTSISVSTPVAFSEKVTVGKDKQYQTINAALDAVAHMNRPNKERVEIVIDPGNYEEMLTVNLENVSLVNAAGDQSSIALKNKGVDITDNAVRVTSYYGHGYNYYSMGSDCKYDADLLAANKENGYLSTSNPGSGTTNGSYWNATVVVNANGFEADGIIFENSFNQYISEKEAADQVVMWPTGSKGERSTTAGDTSVQKKSFVERAAAMAIVGDKSVFNNCKFIGRQDTLYGGSDIDAVFQKCNILGGTDYIFGGMRAVFYQCDLTMNTENTAATDVSYITAAQQSSGRGYLMYNCNVTSTTPGVDTASEYRSKQGYFGRPWAANTSEVVYFMTTVETTDDPATPGQSLIAPAGWNNSLGGNSSKMYEYGTKELSGENNLANRADWATTLTTPYIEDGKVDINIKAFLGDWADELQSKGLVKELTANYAAVQPLINQAAALNPKDYKDFSQVQQVLDEINTNKIGIAHQDQLDALMQKLAKAVAGLQKVEPETKPDPQPETKPEPTPEVKPDPTPEVKPGTSPEGTTEATTEAATEATEADQNKTGNGDASVATGDRNLAPVYIILLGMAVVAVAGVTFYSRKKKIHR